jgi:protein-disulfide isomerase
MLSRTLLLAAALPAFGCAEPDEEPADAARETAAAVAPATADSILVARADQARIMGDSAAPVWVVIVSDFQCPYCKTWHDSVYPAVRREFVDPGRVRLAYLHLPLPQHQHAQATAELAMCAGAQGRFWEMHDLIFETQREWAPLPAGTDYFRSLASRVAVDTAHLARCMDAGTMRSIVRGDYARAGGAGVRSTPSFFVGDRTLTGVIPIDSFRTAIAEAMRRGPARSGTTGNP